MSQAGTYDVFISHASEDKLEVARPLASLLLQAGLRVWLDELELKIGDSLRRKIDSGLSTSKFGVVILSKAFFSKEWTKKELDALVAREDGLEKVILPVWHKVSAPEIRNFSPMLADRLGTSTDAGIQAVAGQIVEAINAAKGESPEIPIKGGAGPESIQQLIVNFLDELQERAESPTELVGLATGFYDLDRVLEGLVQGYMYVLASRPSIGATTFAFNVAQNVSVSEGLPALYFSARTSSSELSSRLVASVGRISRSHLASGMLTDEEWPCLTEAIEKVRDVPLYIDSAKSLNIDEICNRSRKAAIELGKIGLIVIDSLESVLGSSAAEAGKTLAVEQCAQLARDLDTVVILIVGVSGGVEDRADKRPMMQDLPAFETIEHRANAVLCLFRDDHYNRDSQEPRVAEVAVIRNRSGLRATVKLAFVPEIARFENLAFER